MDLDRQSEFKRRYKIIVDRRHDPGFFYAVSSTGIFCRPGCPSRTPRPENVLFFESPVEALSRGYRPCRRCNPLGRPGEADAALVGSVCRIIEEAEQEPGLKELADRTGYAPDHLRLRFSRLTGLSPREYAAAVKARRLRSELSRGTPVSPSIYAAGYGSPSRVYEQGDRLLAMTPGQYRRGGEGASLRMGVFPCSLGFVLIAFGTRGVAAVSPGKNAGALEEAFRMHFSRAEITALHEEDTRLAAEVIRKIDNPGMDIDIPMDIRGTIFQKRVWDALLRIPAGETRSYSDIAGEIGNPRAARAVAAACAKNEIAVLVPCHRVVGKDGDLKGYRWGPGLKRRLLERDKKTSG